MPFLKQSSVIVLLLNLLGLGGLGFVGYQLNRDANQIITSYQELYTANRGKENLLGLNKSLADTPESRAVVSQAFLSGDGLIAFIEKLEGLAHLAGVTLDLDEPKPVTEKGKPARLDLDFRASGSFAGLSRLLALVENLPYRLDWREVAWTFNSGTTWSGSFSLAVISYLDIKK